MSHLRHSLVQRPTAFGVCTDEHHSVQATTHTRPLFDVVNPATNAVVCQVVPASEEEVDNALDSVAARQPEWAALPAGERAETLTIIGHLVRQNASAFAADDVAENGRLLRSVLGDDVHTAADCFLDAAQRLRLQERKTSKTDAGLLVESWMPHGVCVGIGAWNYPLPCAAAKIAPALACGNGMVFKPALQTPSSSLRLGRLIASVIKDRHPACDGILQIALGGAETGAALVGSSRTRMVSLTGSVATGQAVAAASASTFKRLVLELGGKSALVVLDDADVDTAVSIALHANFIAAGQVCTAASRVLVHSSLLDAFRTRFVTAVKELRIGPPRDKASDIGPLVSIRHANRVRQQVSDCIRRGARCLTGDPSEAIAPRGFGSSPITEAYVAPVVLADVPLSDSILHTEVFGPVTTLHAFSSDDQAVALANSTDFGLAAGVVSTNGSRAENIAAQLRAGVVWINSYHEQPAAMAFGGVDMSGQGREGGPLGFAAYAEPRSILVAYDAGPERFEP